MSPDRYLCMYEQQMAEEKKKFFHSSRVYHVVAGLSIKL